MTVEQLHDALTQLPDDLIAGADAGRNPKPRVIPFKRYAALAASFAVVVACSLFCMRLLSPKGATESMKEVEAAAYMAGAAAAQGTEAPAAAEPAALEPQAAAAMEESGNTDSLREDSEESPAEDVSANAPTTELRARITIHTNGQALVLSDADTTSLLKLLKGLTYDPQQVCNCLAEYMIEHDNGKTWELNLTEGFVRTAQGQALLTTEETNTIRSIIDKLEH